MEGAPQENTAKVTSGREKQKPYLLILKIQLHVIRNVQVHRRVVWDNFTDTPQLTLIKKYKDFSMVNE